MVVNLRRSVFAVVFFLTGAFAGSMFSSPALAVYQPHMRTALGYLNQALGELQIAIPDKAGHREKAIDLTRRAIAQAQAGIVAGRR